MSIKKHLGKFFSFVGILVIAINQFLQLVHQSFSKWTLLGIGFIVLVIGFFADEMIKIYKRK